MNYITITLIYVLKFIDYGYVNMRQGSFQKQHLTNHVNIQESSHNPFPRARSKLLY